MKQPTGQAHEILQMLITAYPNRISVLDIVYQTKALNHTARISNLRNKGVEIKCIIVQGYDKYGKSCKHTYYKLLELKKAQIIEAHYCLNKK